MKIIDTNILNKLVRGEITLDLAEKYFHTGDLRDEIENLKSMSSEYRKQIEVIQFVDMESHNYYNESRFLDAYARYINKYNRIISFYGMKGFGDISILAAVDVILNPLRPNLFETNQVEVITNDQRLKTALIEEFGSKVIVTSV